MMGTLFHCSAGVDYSSLLGTILRFSENSPTSRCVDINIRDDTVFEEDEIFTVLLTDIPSEGVVLRPDMANVTIIDETCKLL